MKKEHKIDWANYLKYSFALSIASIIIILIIFIFFLYKNVYQTIAEAQELTSLRQNVISEKIEKTRFSEIIYNIKNKIGTENYTSTTNSTLPIVSSSTLLTATSTVKRLPTSTTKHITSTATSSPGKLTPTSTKTTSTKTTSTPKK